MPTRASAGHPEIIFETTKDFQVLPAELSRCIAVDWCTSADRTRRARGEEAGSFAAFQGEEIRERVLFLRDDLLTDPDPAVREHATVDLLFKLAQSNSHTSVPDAKGWQLRWFYRAEADWVPVPDSQVADETAGLTKNGAVRIKCLPDSKPAEVNGKKDVWIACQLQPAGVRLAVPQILSIDISRKTDIPVQQVLPQVCMATQSGVAVTEVKPQDPFYPFGQFPALLDGLYIRSDEAFTKPGAKVKLHFELDGLPPQIEDSSTLEQLTIAWEYHSKQGWTPMGSSRWGCPAMAFADLHDPQVENISVRPGTNGKQVEIQLPGDYATEDVPAGFPPGTITKKQIDNHLFYVSYVTDLPAACADVPDQIIKRGRSYSSDHLDFSDATCAFTAGGAGAVEFTVPVAVGDNPAPDSCVVKVCDPQFAPVVVNGQSGYWIRGRIVAGGFSAPQSVTGNFLQKLLVGKTPPPPPRALPPLVRKFQVEYTDYKRHEPLGGKPRPIQGYFGKTDGGGRGPVAGQPFDAFAMSVEDRPQALYLGFSPLDSDPAHGRVPFPDNGWVEVYVGIEESVHDSGEPGVAWHYWNGKEWHDLDVVDEQRGLQRSGTVGFFAPSDHSPGSEFFGPASLDPIHKPGEAPAAAPGKAAGGQPNAKAAKDVYWLRVYPKGQWLPRLTAVQVNTVPAINGETINDEVLGSSNGDKNQVFASSRHPVLPDDFEVEVQEPIEETKSASNTWRSWKPESTLLACGPLSRCYILDPDEGTITFGDNVRGMIPPAGQNNIKVKRYHTHNAEAGNLPAGTITLLRNPKGTLSKVRQVKLFEVAAGGAALEETAHVEVRGPHALKNRGRAVTAEDFEWIGQDIPGVRRLHCLPAHKADGSSEPGWVTAVVVPERSCSLGGPKGPLIPAPALLRQVRERLESVGLANLAHADAAYTVQPGPEDPDQIYVTGPGFVQVEVVTKVVAQDPTKADDLREQTRSRLEAFLDPLDGGPERQGWAPGRSVYISEVKAEIESVAGVDHVKTAYLRAPSRLQQRLTMKRDLEVAMPGGSQVGTCDGRVKAVLAQTLPQGTRPNEVPVTGFNVGDVAIIDGVASAALRLKESKISSKRLNDNLVELTFDQPLDPAEAALIKKVRDESPDLLTVVSDDGRLQAPIANLVIQTDDAGHESLQGVVVSEFVANVGDIVRINRSQQSAPPAVRVKELHDNLVELTFDKPLDPAETALIKKVRDESPDLLTVVSDDGRLRKPIANLVIQTDDTGQESLQGVVVSEFVVNVKDIIRINRPQQSAPPALRVKELHNNLIALVFDQRLDPVATKSIKKSWRELPELLGVVSADGRVRAPIANLMTSGDHAGREYLQGVVVDGFSDDDLVCITHATLPNCREEFLQVQEVTTLQELDCVFVSADHLVFSGSHAIEMVLE